MNKEKLTEKVLEKLWEDKGDIPVEPPETWEGAMVRWGVERGIKAGRKAELTALLSECKNLENNWVDADVSFTVLKGVIEEKLKELKP